MNLVSWLFGTKGADPVKAVGSLHAIRPIVAKIEKILESPTKQKRMLLISEWHHLRDLFSELSHHMQHEFGLALVSDGEYKHIMDLAYGMQDTVLYLVWVLHHVPLDSHQQKEVQAAISNLQRLLQIDMRFLDEMKKYVDAIKDDAYQIGQNNPHHAEALRTPVFRWDKKWRLFLAMDIRHDVLRIGSTKDLRNYSSTLKQQIARQRHLDEILSDLNLQINNFNTATSKAQRGLQILVSTMTEAIFLLHKVAYAYVAYERAIGRTFKDNIYINQAVHLELRKDLQVIASWAYELFAESRQLGRDQEQAMGIVTRARKKAVA